MKLLCAIVVGWMFVAAAIVMACEVVVRVWG
jgi:hypothetical protein